MESPQPAFHILEKARECKHRLWIKTSSEFDPSCMQLGQTTWNSITCIIYIDSNKQDHFKRLISLYKDIEAEREKFQESLERLTKAIEEAENYLEYGSITPPDTPPEPETPQPHQPEQHS